MLDNYNSLTLSDVINIKDFEHIQSSLAKITGTAILLVDIAGRQVSTHSNCTEFCRKARSAPNLRLFCEMSDAISSYQAMKLRTSYFSYCHMGLVDFALPIHISDHYLGALMCGQVNVVNHNINQIAQSTFNSNQIIYESEKAEFAKMFDKVPKKGWQELVDVSDLLKNTLNYIINEKVQYLLAAKNLNEDILSSDEGIRGKLYAEENANTALNHMLQIYSSNSIIQPAIRYIQQNYDQDIRLDELSALCNISSSHFSHIFNKSIGVSFVKYINQLRIERSKELLHATSLSIEEISEQCRFNSSTYFIKVFREYTNMTPKQYRDSYAAGFHRRSS